MRRRAALLAAVLLVLTSCAGEGGGGLRPARVDVDVDTASLRAQKAELGVEDCAAGTAAPVEGGLPEVTLPCLAGGPDVPLASLRGPLVVSLWASWCTSCRREMPLLQAFHAEYGDRVPVLGVDFQDLRPSAAMDLLAVTGATYPSLADPGGELNGAPPFPVMRGLPFLALVDEDGRVVHQEFVIITSEQQLRDLVAEHLGVTL